MDYNFDDLQAWSDKIERIALDSGLTFYSQEFEIIDFNEMLAYEAYVGMPSRYPHWSFGKAFEKQKTLYRYNLTGLPYEMVINSKPCIADLLKENTLLLQILTIAHVYAHNDFFMNNRIFREETDASYTIENFKNDAGLIRSYINDPSIGYEAVEKILNAAHAIKLQTSREIGGKRRSHEELKKKLLDDYREKAADINILEPRKEIPFPDLNKIPLEPEEDILYFIINHSQKADWEKNILDIVRRETRYFIPQIETKTMNEGWASYWHYQILNKLNLPSALHMEFIKRHNDVVAPFRGYLNPYFLGFRIYEEIAKKNGIDKIFEVRALERDQSFIRKYLSKELCMDLNLFSYMKKGADYIINEVSDEQGWTKVRDAISSSAGMGMVPLIRVVDVWRKDGSLVLEHLFEGKELLRSYAEETLKYLVDLWGKKVILKTRINGIAESIICDENKQISVFRS